MKNITLEDCEVVDILECLQAAIRNLGEAGYYANSLTSIGQIHSKMFDLTQLGQKLDPTWKPRILRGVS